MKPEEFKELLLQAISGNKKSVEAILKLYEPMITRSSYIKGTFDQDLKQYIMLHIIKNISKFNFDI